MFAWWQALICLLGSAALYASGHSCYLLCTENGLEEKTFFKNKVLLKHLQEITATNFIRKLSNKILFLRARKHVRVEYGVQIVVLRIKLLQDTNYTIKVIISQLIVAIS